MNCLGTFLIFVFLISASERVKSLQDTLGESEAINLNDIIEKYKINFLLRMAMISINQRANNLYRHNLVRIQRAYKTQVFDGTLFHITFYTGQSNCRNYGMLIRAMLEDQCSLSSDANAQFQACSVKVHEHIASHVINATDFKCTFIDRETALPRNTNPETFVLPPTSMSRVLDFQEDLKIWPRFLKFIDDFNKTYDNKTHMVKRYKIFKQNMKTVQILQENETGTAKYGATIFADMTPEEFTKNFLTPVWEDTGYPPRISPLPLEPIPDKWDWRTKNVVTEVKNQGMCGSCWAFCTTGNIEGVWALKTGKLVSLSEQQLVDCDKLDEGCNGGLPSNAYKEIIRMGGLESEGDYPYKGSRKQCNNNQTLEKVYINSSIALPKDEVQMAQYLYKNGPLAIGINANPLMFYFGGIAHPWKFLCSPKMLNHGVTIVGYGVQGNKPYWLIKNSWGKWWGESGYFRLYRGEGVCGVDQMVTSVTID